MKNSQHTSLNNELVTPNLINRIKLFLLKWHKVDIWGSLVGFICALHCLALPYLFLILPLNTLILVKSNFVEWFIFLCSFSLGFYSIIHGYLHHHFKKFTVFLFIIGFLLIISDRLWSTTYHYKSVTGGLLLCFTHLYNWLRISKKH